MNRAQIRLIREQLNDRVSPLRLRTALLSLCEALLDKSSVALLTLREHEGAFPAFAPAIEAVQMHFQCSTSEAQRMVCEGEIKLQDQAEYYQLVLRLKLACRNLPMEPDASEPWFKILLKKEL